MDHYLLIFMMKHIHFWKERKRRMGKGTSYMIYVSLFNALFFFISQCFFYSLFQEELKNRWLSLANDPSEIHKTIFFMSVFVWRKSEKRVMMLNNNNNDDDVAKEIATLCVTIIAFSYEISFFFFVSYSNYFFIYFSCFLVFGSRGRGRRQKKNYLNCFVLFKIGCKAKYCALNEILKKNIYLK